jgi:hypothetical protein
MGASKLTFTYRQHARSSKNMMCGLELSKQGFYAYVLTDKKTGNLHCCLFVNDECIILKKDYSPYLIQDKNKLDALVDLIRYTITTPTTNENYLEWRDSEEARYVDRILDRYEDDYVDAVITLYNAYYSL